MSETGVVVEIDGDQAIIEMEASKDCEACGACRYTKAGRMLAPVTNSLNAGIGDIVKIEIEPQTVLVAAFLVYILPIVFFFLGYAIGLSIGRFAGFSAERAGIGGGIVFLVLSYMLVKKVDKQAKITRRYEPKMCVIIQKN